MSVTVLARHNVRRVGLIVVTLVLLAAGIVRVTPAYAADSAAAEYSVVGDHAVVTGCIDPCVGAITIADRINDQPVTEIGSNAFADRSSLTGHLAIPDTVTNIGLNAFKQTGITSVDLGESVETIGNGAFWLATGLDGLLSIPASVETIGSNAFRGAAGLDEVRFLGNAPTINSTAFADTMASTTSTTPRPLYRKASATARYWNTALTGSRFVAVNDPTFTGHPSDAALTTGQNVSLSGLADAHEGGGSLTYQWFKDGQAITEPVGGTGANLTITNAAVDDSGVYTIKATGWVGTTESSGATVTVTASPTPEPEPQPQPSTPTQTPTPAVPVPTPTPVQVKTNQSVKVKLPAALKRNKKYALPRTTIQGLPTSWKPAKNLYCTIKRATLHCTKSTKTKKLKITVAAPGTSTLNAYKQTFLRKVK